MPKNGLEKRHLIVNADDFGENQEINNGIVKTHQNGIVTSASLLTNMPGFEHALNCIKDNPRLDIGIHLNVYRGTPLTPCPYLTRQGKFLCNPLFFLWRCYRNKECARKEIINEFETQIRKALGAEIRISHLDTEKHLHTLPFVFEIVLTVAEKFNIPFVRLPVESNTLSGFLNPTQLYKIVMMTLCAPFNRQLLRKSACRAPNQFYGVSLSKRFSIRRVEKFIKLLRPGFSELSCHPGFSPRVTTNYIDAYRQQELETLTDERLKNEMAKSGVLLSTFSDIR